MISKILPQNKEVDRQLPIAPIKVEFPSDFLKILSRFSQDTFETPQDLAYSIHADIIVHGLER